MTLERRKPCLKYVLIIIASCIFLSSLYKLSNIDSSNINYSRNDATGFKVHQANRFFYFYNELGYFPLATDKATRQLVENPNAAKFFINKYPMKLRMEVSHWYRFGESARIWALYPSYWLGDSIGSLSLKPLNTIVFGITLIILMTACLKKHGILLSLISGTLFISSPFIVSESFLKDNVFSLHPMLILLCISILALANGYNQKAKVIATITTSIIAALFSEIRGEILTVILIPIIYWIIIPKINIKNKIFYTIIILLTMILTKQLIRAHFENSFDKTISAVERAGGVIFEGGSTSAHPIWHPLLVGLGDFGGDKGYELNDYHAFERVLSNKDYTLTDIQNIRSSYYDEETKFYYKRPETLPFYSSLAKDEFLSAIGNDPIWYLRILANRTIEIFTEVPPITFYILDNKVEISQLYAFFIIFIIFVIRRKHCPPLTFNRMDFFCIMASLTISIGPFIFFSARGNTYSSLIPIVSILLLLRKIK